MLNVNLKSVFFLSQAVARHVIDGGHRGKIINIASMLSFQGGVRVASYTASKSGLAGLTKLLANEWAPHGINVNAIAPGYFVTDNTAALRADEKRNGEILGRIPAGRWGDPSDLAGAAVFLASVRIRLCPRRDLARRRRLAGALTHVTEQRHIVCFGEILIRLSSPDGELLLQRPSLDVHVGGAEANVAVSLARFGNAVRMVSVVPPNAPGSAAVGELKRHGVDTAGVARHPGRMGLYFLSPGAVTRPTAVLYDRARSAFALAAPSAVDWSRELAGASWLHLSGIASALGEQAAAANQRAAEAAASLGVAVSFNGNYRELLWAENGGNAPLLLRRILAVARVAFIDDRDVGSILGTAFCANRRSRTPPRGRGRGVRATAARTHLFDDTNRERCTPSRGGCGDVHAHARAQITHVRARWDRRPDRCG